MEKLTCPYCAAEISMDEVEKNAGACPECDAMVTGSLLFDEYSSSDDEDFEDDDLNDLDEDDLDDEDEDDGDDLDDEDEVDL